MSSIRQWRESGRLEIGRTLNEIAAEVETKPRPKKDAWRHQNPEADVGVVALVVVAWGVYFVGTVYLENDEVLDCQLKQWWAGGKKPPEMDFSSNISFQTDQNNVVADFRSLDKHWSKICLTSFYQPGSPYLYPHENLAGQSRRTIGCWRGDDPAHLTLMLLNRQTGEGEDYRIPVPADLQDRRRAPILETNYRIPRLPDGVSQCSEVSAAVATCKRDATASRDYCLLVFHR